MASIGWIQEILGDLEHFCKLNALEETTHALENARKAIANDIVRKRANEQAVELSGQSNFPDAPEAVLSTSGTEQVGQKRNS